MANNSPTIVAASLSDDQLKKSIDSLVSHVDEAMKKMVQSTNNAVGEMEAKLKSLGNLKIDSNGTADGGSSRRTSAVEKETRARKELNMTLDQQAAALEKATGRKKGIEYMTLQSDVDKSLTYLVNVNKDVDAQLAEIMRKEQALIEEKKREAHVTEQIANAQRAANSARGVSAYDLGINPTVSAGRQRQIESTRRVSKETEYLKQQIASLLEVEEREVKSVNTATSSYEKLSQYLKQLQSAYNKLGADLIKKGEGVDIANEIQRVQRSMQKLQQTMSRPTSLKAAMGLSEKTLDDIAYKMRQLASYRSGLNVETQTKEIDQVNRKYAELQKKMNDIMRKNTEMIASNTALGRSWNYMKNRLAFYFSVGASTAFIKNLIEVRSQYEMNERALGILIDSAERGTQIFNELSQMALVSPYTLIELSTAAKQLTAYDVAAKDVVDTTRRLADMAAAVGIPIERLTYALGQIKAYGYLNSRDARMFANAGIPLVKQLSEYYTELEGRLVSTADVYDRIKKKAIDYNEVMEVINKMTDEGGKFFDFQAKMADTLKVRLANLTLAWNNMLNDIGKSSQGMLTWGIGALRELFLHWKQFSSAIYSAAWAGGLVIGLRALNVLLVKAGLNFRILSKDMTAAGIAGQGLATKMSALGKSIAALAKSSLTWWSLLAFAIVDAAKDLYYINEAQENLNKSIRDGAKDNYDNISKFLEQYKEVRDSLYSTEKVAIGSIYNPTTRKAEATAYAEQQVGQDIDKNEAKKAWEAIREQIELTSQSSDVYISKLLTIENMSERVRQGFNILDDIQIVNAALKDIDDDTIRISKDWSKWWNAWQAPDGLVTNLKDLEESEKRLLSAHDSVREALTSSEHSTWAQDYLRDLERVREDLKVTTDSVIDFIELKGWSGDTGKINQVFEQFTQKFITDNGLSPSEAYNFQLLIEEARSKAAKDALQKRIADEEAALKVSGDEQVKQALESDKEELANWDSYNGRKKVEWERFTKWLKEQHISETTAMFRDMDAEDIKSLNFQEGKHAEWVTRMVTQYAKEHKMSYDEAFGYLKNWVSSANQWSIFLPLIISTEDKKSVFEQLGEYDQAIDTADSQIARLTKRINELKAKRKLDKEELQELVHAQQELTDAEKAKADAEAKGGHGKKEVKDEKAARKAAKQAESELAKALKEELSVIDKVRSIYKDLIKEGASYADAVERATAGWEETLNSINKVLVKNGLQKLDLTKFVGIENPRELVTLLQVQLNKLVGRGAKPAEIKELQAKINTLLVDADKYDLTKITKGLNSELDKLKDEYELAVELDANPELGGIFADLIGIDKAELDKLPKDFQGVMNRLQTIIDETMKDDRFELLPNLNKTTFDNLLKARQIDASSELAQKMKAIVDYANKVRKDETTKQIDDWKKLLEKYAEYEYKRNQIIETARRERETASKEGASGSIMQAIDNREKQELARLDFEEFQKSSYWVTATGDLAKLSNNAIGLLIQRLEEYKKKAKNLDPKQIKQLNNALSKLYKEQRKNNPFKAVGDMLQQARERVADYQSEIDELERKIQHIETLKNLGIATDAHLESLPKLIEKLKELKAAQESVGEIDATDWVESINATVSAVKAAVSVFDDLAKAIGGVNTSDVDKVFSVIEKGGQGAAIGAQFGGYGALIGGVLGAATGLVEILANADNERINRKIKESETAVKRLEVAYVDLQQAIDKAYGAGVVGAKRAMAAAKELQLVELERQLALERSRSSKNRDDDRILELQKEIKELRYEIQGSIREITDDLLGSDVGSFAENLVSSMIDAFKQGEDYMGVFEESFDKMIDNMIMKSIVSRVVAQYLDQIWNSVDARIQARTQNQQEEYMKALEEANNMETMSFYEWLEKNGRMGYFEIASVSGRHDIVEQLRAMYEAEKAAAKAAAQAAKDNLDAASGIDNTDISWLIDELNKIRPELGERLKEILGEYYTFGQESDKQLSALQQGIQGITEETAGALEAYMNSVSQQVYLHSDLLTQIRDAVVGFDIDVQTASLSQILLQLQSNYIVMQSMQSMMDGWTIPSGQGIRVELMS